jgi:hypothetical protein
MSKRLVLVAVACFVLLLAGCKVDATVTVDVRDDGSGVVRVTALLDADAVKGAEAGGGKLEDRVRLADLSGAGWTVEPWVRAADGSAKLTLSKPFAGPAQATAILAEVNGAVGPLRDMHVARDHGLLSTKYSVAGTIDLAKLGTGVTSDQELVQSLSGQRVDVNALDQSLLTEARNALSLKVVAALPNGTTTIVGRAGKATPVDASTSVLDAKRIGFIVLAAVLVLVAVLVLLWPGRRRRRRRRDRGRRPAAAGAVPARAPAPAAGAPPTTRGTPPTS